MCRDNDHGGRRCPHDTSEARQARRLAAKERQSRINVRLHNAFHQQDTLPDYTDLAAVTDYAQRLRDKLRAAPDTDLDEYDQDQADAEQEEALTNFGKVIAARVEAAAGFRRAEVETEVDALEQEIYGNRRERIDNLLEAATAVKDDLRPLIKRISDAEGLAGWQVYGWKKDAFLTQTAVALTDEERNLLENLDVAERAYQAEKDAGEALDAKFEEAADAVYRKYSIRLAAASKRVIAEIRPVGGQVILDATGEGGTQQLLRDTVGKHYPSDWLAWHNESGNTVRVSSTSSRAGYTPSQATDDEPVAATRLQYVKLPTNELGDAQELLDLLPENRRQGQLAYDPSGKNITLITYHDVDHEVYSPEVHGTQNMAQLRENGWVFGPTADGLHDPRVANASTVKEAVAIAVEPRWYRVEKKTHNVQNLMKLYSPTEDDATWENRATTSASIAFHEFAHRIEHVAPNNLLARTERAFLMRRMGKAGMERPDQYDGIQETVLKVSKAVVDEDAVDPKKGPAEEAETVKVTEFYHTQTHMVERYMAREYFKNNSFEVFSCGVESVFGEAYGSLLGLSNRYLNQDDEHRAYTLGVLAVL